MCCNAGHINNAARVHRSSAFKPAGRAATAFLLVMINPYHLSLGEPCTLEYTQAMKKQRIYVDTSVIGGCFDPEFAEWSNGLLQDFRNNLFAPLLSEVTAAEVQSAPESVQMLYAELVALGAEILQVGESALELADEYKRRGILFNSVHLEYG